MIDRKTVFALLLLLVGTTVGLVMWDSWSAVRRSAEKREFQQLVGGLGMGPALDLSICTIAFDPRLATACDAEWSPIPVGTWSCPAHTCSLSVERYGPAH